MADKPTVITLGAGGKYSTSALNTNFTALRDEFANVVGTPGTGGTANAMTGDLDLGGNTIRNAVFDGDVVGMEFEGNWATATAYTANDVILDVTANIVYICNTAHTSSGTEPISTNTDVASWTTLIDAPSEGIGGLDLTFEDTTTDTDQGAGKVWFNHATPASATVLYMDDETAGGTNINTFVDTWDDSTNSTLRGHIMVLKETDSTFFHLFEIDGGVTSASTYTKVPVNHVDGNASNFTDADAVRVQFVRTGNAGGGLADVVDDTSPQLGGNLDLNSNVITGLEIGTNVQAYDAQLDDIAALGVVDGDILVADGANWTVENVLSSSTGTVLGTKGGTIGQQTIWLMAGSLEAAVTTAPATSNAVEIGTSLFAARTMDFATDADDYAYFGLNMPKSWDAGVLLIQFMWSATGQGGGNDSVVWGIAAQSLGSGDVLTTAFGAPTVATLQEHSATNDDIMFTTEVSLTVADAAAEEFVMFEVSRDISADDLDVDARLHGIRIHYTIDTGIDT